MNLEWNQKVQSKEKTQKSYERAGAKESRLGREVILMHTKPSILAFCKAANHTITQDTGGAKKNAAESL